MPIKDGEYIFKQVEGIWRCISAGDSGEILADFLERLEIIVENYAQFTRVIRNRLHIEFRHYGGSIRINIHTLHNV